MRLIFLFVILLGIVYWQNGGNLFSGGSLEHLEVKRHAQGVPVQKRLLRSKSKVYKGFTLNLHNQFAVTALVLSRHNYSTGMEANLSPVDLALGWGPMSNPAPLRLINISQGNRFYYFRYANAPPIKHRDIELNSANMHLIPANDNVAARLKKVKKGHVVTIKGYLTDVRGKNGWRWNSSRTRNDTGDGACEIIYVESISFR